jgi:hypothetical protein
MKLKKLYLDQHMKTYDLTFYICKNCYSKILNNINNELYWPSFYINTIPYAIYWNKR